MDLFKSTTELKHQRCLFWHLHHSVMKAHSLDDCSRPLLDEMSSIRGSIVRRALALLLLLSKADLWRDRFPCSLTL